MSKRKRAKIRKRGYPLPGGVTMLQEGINFSIFSRHATRVTLVIDHWPKGAKLPIRHEFELDRHENRTGDMWHILLATHQQNFTYGYRMDGPADPSMGLVYDYETILIDPYSRALLPRAWGENPAYGQKPCCRIVAQDFDWQKDRPLRTPLSETIIYELHVRGFTNDSSSKVTAPGTFLGIIEKIPYLKSLGITAVELMPVTEFNENDIFFHNPDSDKPLKNFWGYNPVSFFALHSGYAHDPGEAVTEFKTMVLALHKAGIEVILDMVYNHTTEGSLGGKTSSFRGIDNPIYYLLDKENNYLNFSGCGNTVNCNHPVVRHLIRDSLRYWVTEMHIDGFRFDLASILGRDQQGNLLVNPPMIEAIGEDPVLRDTKMIAEAWDAAGLYQVGTFSTDPRWAEWNGRFRDDVRAFMIGKENTVSQLATRIAGSSDLYQPSGRGPLSSINFLTSHDGFTLYDLVSFDRKHNRANGEDSRDGENNNISWNSGLEGLNCPAKIRQLRLRRLKTFTVLLLFSQGVPMICAGDEFCRSQDGNNNAWCQDNEISWLDWSLMVTNKGFHRFFKECVSIRKKHPLFRRKDFFKSIEERPGKAPAPEIAWQYLTPGSQNWAADCHGLGFLLSSPRRGKSSDFFIMLNGGKEQSLSFISPEPQEKGRAWYRTIDTSANSPADIFSLEKAPPHSSKKSITIPPFGCVVLQSDF